MQCACLCRLMNNGFLLSVTLKSKYPSQHKILPWALKWWFSFETKGLKGCHIAWLVWRLTMTMAWHYMHQVDMKRWRLIKNKVMAWHVAASVKKTLLIPHTNVIHLTLVGENNVNYAWMLQSQHHPNVIYNFHAPFTKYASYGHCMGICASIRLFSWHVRTLFQTISLIIAAHGMGLIMVSSRQCL